MSKKKYIFYCLILLIIIFAFWKIGCYYFYYIQILKFYFNSFPNIKLKDKILLTLFFYRFDNNLCPLLFKYYLYVDPKLDLIIADIIKLKPYIFSIDIFFKFYKNICQYCGADVPFWIVFKIYIKVILEYVYIFKVEGAPYNEIFILVESIITSRKFLIKFITKVVYMCLNC